MKIDKIVSLKHRRILYALCPKDKLFPRRYIVAADDNYYGLVEVDGSDYIKTYGTYTELEVFFATGVSGKWEKVDCNFFATTYLEDNQSCVLVEKAELFNYLREITQ